MAGGVLQTDWFLILATLAGDALGFPEGQMRHFWPYYRF
jgi:hypothetical protein